MFRGCRAPVLVLFLVVSAACGNDDQAPTSEAVTAPSSTATAVPQTTATTAATPDSTTTTTVVTTTAVEMGADPWGLTTIGMPQTQAEVTATLIPMPDEIGGLARQEPPDPDEEHVATVDYGGEGEGMGISMYAQPADSRGGMPPAEFIALMMEGEEFEITASAVDPAETLVWIAGTATLDPDDPEVTAYVAAWGEPAGEWFFFVAADTAANRDAFISAFVAAAAS